MIESMASKTAQNAILMTMSSVFQKVIAFVYFTIIARMIDVQGIGVYFLAMSFTSIFSVFIDAGFTNVMVREVAKHKDKADTYLSNVVFIKLFFALFAYIAIVSTVTLLQYDSAVRHLVYVSGFVMIFDSFVLSVYGIFRAHAQLKYEALSMIVAQVATLMLGTVFLYMRLPLISLMFAFLIPSMGNLVYATIMLKRVHGIGLRPHYDRAILKHIIVIAFPFALAGIFSRFYSYADSVILSKLLDEHAVGLYSIPYKVTYAFQFIPLAFVAALYPKFSEYYATDRKKLAEIFEKSFIYLLLLAVPISVGIAVLAPDIIVTMFGPKYIDSVLTQQVLIISLIFSFVSFPIGAFLNACDRQVTQTIIVVSALIMNIIANFLCIPIFGIVGAAIAALLGNIVLTIGGLYFVPKIANMSYDMLVIQSMRIVLAALAMGVLVFVVNVYVHFLFAVIFGAIVYGLLLLAFKVVRIADITETMHLFKRNT